MTQRPSLRGIPEWKVLEARQLSDGKWIFKISNRKGAGDFRVSVYDSATKRQLTPSYAHFAIDLYGKLCRNENDTGSLLEAIEEIYYGTSALDAMSKLSATGLVVKLGRLPGYSVEYTLNALEFIFAQEDVTWERDFIEKGKPLPRLRKKFIQQGFLSQAEAKDKGSAIAMHLLRRVVRYRIHPVEAMREVGLRIVAGYA